ncbi:DUF805 domain-containing protein [Brevundimonas variabilis]|uniref:Uncharacterized membrane protein YhaH (DUF805 family) n=1 Tax=Brevundimonas variabilis TaxID=74312 RepID=A0A7W9FF01_9CAUL|nr:DUF805 domain-containing protein [Brevundimonas variabilis]MBB5746892.1 uncharacterized membrane protein YhaH (DUF805 family) [Brevundimonas variabilis]
MRGIILDFDPVASTGRISGDDGNRYGFVSASLQAGATVRSGQKVDFVADGDSATQIVTLVDTPSPSRAEVFGNRSGAEPAYDFRTALFAFNGRLRRQHFWISWLILLGVGAVANFIPILGVLISIGLIWPNLAITVTRLHDMGRSGWLAAIPYAVSIVGMIVAVSMMGLSIFTNYDALEREDPAAIFALVGPIFGVIGLVTLISLGFLLWIGVTESQPGENRFGPNPKHPIDSSVFN